MQSWERLTVPSSPQFPRLRNGGDHTTFQGSMMTREGLGSPKWCGLELVMTAATKHARAHADVMITIIGAID